MSTVLHTGRLIVSSTYYSAAMARELGFRLQFQLSDRFRQSIVDKCTCPTVNFESIRRCATARNAPASGNHLKRS